MFSFSFKKIVFVSGLIILLVPIFISADIQGEVKNFFVDPSYDAQQREQISAILKKISQKGYFYLEREWYQNLTEGEKKLVNKNLSSLAKEFDFLIYPKITKTFGKEWQPGIDNDVRITVLFQRMKEKAGGYFDSSNEYPKVQNPHSNEREMVYLSAKTLFSEISKPFLAHEFVHLITFNQKEKKHKLEEKVWLNELRADYAPSFLGYDEKYPNYFEERLDRFLKESSDSLIEWKNKKSDYGLVNIFAHYLVDHYGIEILGDSLKSPKVGIASLNSALKKHGFSKTLSEIFVDWTIAVFLNDCQVAKKYCFLDKKLKDLKVLPSLIFLPSNPKTEMVLNYSTKDWAGNWYQIIGGNGDLKVEIETKEKTDFTVPYLLCKDSKKCQVNFLKLKKTKEEKKRGEILIKDFKKKWFSLVLIPSFRDNLSDVKEEFPPRTFTISLTTFFSTSTEISQLLEKISFLKKEILKVKKRIAILLKKKIGCKKFERDLFYGKRGKEVVCLQKFLKLQGKQIYPEGLITGFFGSLTKKALIRFQRKYSKEILFPLGLTKATGFFGPKTRKIINQILNPNSLLR